MNTVDIVGSPDGALDDYQVKFIVHRGNGRNYGADVYLNGHSLSWPQDIRFLNNSGSPLDYWIESYDQNTALVWVKVDSIPAYPDTAIIKIYYGKADDTGQSNGDRTFVFFDDFNGPVLDTNKWYVYDNGGSSFFYRVRDGELYISSRNSIFGVGSKTKVGPYGYAFEMRVKASDLGGDEIGADYRTDGRGPITFAKVYHDGDNRRYTNYNDGVFSNSDRSTDYSDYQRLSILWTSSGVKYLESGKEKANIANNVPKSQMGLNFAVNTISTDRNITIDWAAIRKYVQDEPAPGGWSGEAQAKGQPAITPAVTVIPASVHDYSYVKSHTINGSPDGALTDYQVKLVVHRGSGTDSDQDVYLNGHSQRWPKDIRFTSGTGNLLDHWVEAYDENVATVWVKVDGIPESPGTAIVHLYYGRPGDAGTSNGTATFPFYEDWSSYPAGRNISGQGGWTVSRLGDTGHATVLYDGGVNVLSIGSSTPDNSVITHSFPLRNGQAFRYKAKKLSGSDNLQLGASDGSLALDGTMMNGYDTVYGGYSQAYTKIRKHVNGSEFDVARVPDNTGDTNYHTYEWTWSGDSLGAFRDGIKLADGRDPTWASESTIALSIYQANTYCGYVLVRNFTLNEPVHGPWGMEKQILPPPEKPSGYAYEKANKVQGSPDGDLEDYQIKYSVHRGDGIDSGRNVYLNGHSMSWPKDIRFTDSDDDPYSYWIESYDSRAATIWVKVDHIPASPGSATILLHYGKANDASMSDGDSTFLAFDDFSTDRRGTYWNESYSMDGAWAWTPTHTIEKGAYHLKVPKQFDGAGYLQLKNALASPSVSVVTLSYNNLYGRVPPWVYISVDDGGAANRYHAYTIGYWGGILGGFNPSSPSDKLRIEWSDGTAKNNIRIYRDDSLQATGSANFGTTRTPSFGLRTASMETIDAYFTSFYAYKYTANPPSYGAWIDSQAPPDDGLRSVIPGLSETDILLLIAIAIILVIIVVLLAIICIIIFMAFRSE